MVEVTRKMIDAADYYLCGYYVADDDIENTIKDAIEASDEIRQLRELRDNLLEALKWAVDFIGNKCEAENHAQVREYKKAVAAIAKAEGKQ